MPFSFTRRKASIKMKCSEMPRIPVHHPVEMTTSPANLRFPLKHLFRNLLLTEKTEFSSLRVGLGGLGVTRSPRDPSFEGSNTTEVDGFFQDVKILSTGDFKLRFQAR